jgi:hypothetical protein
MQIFVNTDNHVDAVSDLVARVRNEIDLLVPLQPASHARGVHLSDHNADRGEHKFGGRGSCGVGIPAS